MIRSNILRSMLGVTFLAMVSGCAVQSSTKADEPLVIEPDPDSEAPGDPTDDHKDEHGGGGTLDPVSIDRPWLSSAGHPRQPGSATSRPYPEPWAGKPE